MSHSDSWRNESSRSGLSVEMLQGLLPNLSNGVQSNQNNSHSNNINVNSISSIHSNSGYTGFPGPFFNTGALYASSNVSEVLNINNNINTSYNSNNNSNTTTNNNNCTYSNTYNNNNNNGIVNITNFHQENWYSPRDSGSFLKEGGGGGGGEGGVGREIQKRQKSILDCCEIVRPLLVDSEEGSFQSSTFMANSRWENGENGVNLRQVPKIDSRDLELTLRVSSSSSEFSTNFVKKFVENSETLSKSSSKTRPVKNFVKNLVEF